MKPRLSANCVARTLLLLALVSACLSLGAAERLAPPAVNAASAAKTEQESPLPSSTAACLRPSDQVAACQPGPQLSLTPIALPSARLGVAYKPRRMVTGGIAPYRVDVINGSKPEGLDFTPDGSLAGLPVGPVRAYTFTVHVTDSSAPPLSVRQAYVLRVEKLAPPRKAASDASANSVVVPVPVAPVVIPPGPAQVTSYMLLQEDLDDMFPKPITATASALGPEAAASAPRKRLRLRPAAFPTAFADKMQAMLGPLIHVDFPTAGLLAQALEARRCAYFRSVVNQAAVAAGRVATPADLKCQAVAPAAQAGASSQPPSSGVPGVSPTLYADLLPEILKTDLIAQAQWQHPLDGNAKPPAWVDNGCGCAPPITDDWSYGIYPFWQGQDAEPQKIDFSLFSRIGYLGAQLSDNGGLVKAIPFDSAHDGFTRTAHRFGTRVDLIVHRSEWSNLLSQPYQTELIQRAVTDIVKIVDTRMTDGFTTAKRYLLPGWDEPVHMFDGVTLFFDNAPTDAEGKKKFEAFYTSFVYSLIAEMQKTKRSYALNIVAPATEIGKDGAYHYSHLWNYIQRAQMFTEANALAGEEEKDYKGTTDITVSVLALLAEPTSRAKKELRAGADAAEVIHGHSRVAVLKSIAPVLFHAAGNTGLAGMRINEQQFDDDLAYFKSQFRGMALWPMPLHDTVVGPAVYSLLAKNFSPKFPGAIDGMCQWVCPNRSAMRLLFMGLLVIGVVAFGLYYGVCSVRGLGRPYIAFLWLGGVVTVAVGLLLLRCDPQLAHVRRGNGPLVVLLVVTVATGMYYSLRSRTDQP